MRYFHNPLVSNFPQINIDGENCKKVLQQLTEKNIHEDLFENVLSVVRGNLLDSFCRLRTTAEYKHYLKDLQARKEVEKKSGII